MFEKIDELEDAVKKCSKCKMCVQNSNRTLGIGDINARVLFVGDGVTQNNEAVIKLLEQACLGVGIDKKDVYITDVVKCQTISSQKFENEDFLGCMDYLRNQVLLIKPKVIVLLGNLALKKIINEDLTITSCRGKWIDKKEIKYMPTYHMSALLRNENLKIDFWQDLKLVAEEIKN